MPKRTKYRKEMKGRNRGKSFNANTLSTEPLPLPILVSSGLAVSGLAGNTIIHILPDLLVSKL